MMSLVYGSLFSSFMAFKVYQCGVGMVNLVFGSRFSSHVHYIFQEYEEPVYSYSTLSR